MSRRGDKTNQRIRGSLLDVFLEIKKETYFNDLRHEKRRFT